MAATEPSPQTWILRFKSHKSTILLHIDPLQTFSSIKAQLLYAIQESGGIKHHNTGEPIPLPSSPSDIQLGRCVNPNIPNKGFELGEWENPPVEQDDDAEDIKGKGKAKAGRPKKSGDSGAAAVKDCPKGAGLRDGAVLAFRWKGDGTNWEDKNLEPGDKKRNMWGVKLARYDDSYEAEDDADGSDGLL